MTRRARLVTLLAYTARIWLEDRHRRTTVAYIDHTRALGTGARTTRPVPPRTPQTGPRATDDTQPTQEPA
jgi:hypothetical protein